MARTSQIKAARARKALEAGSGATTSVGSKHTEPSKKNDDTHRNIKEDSTREDKTFKDKDNGDDEMTLQNSNGDEPRQAKQTNTPTDESEAGNEAEPSSGQSSEDRTTISDSKTTKTTGAAKSEKRTPRHTAKQTPPTKGEGKRKGANDQEPSSPTKKPKKQQPRAGSRKSARSSGGGGNSATTQVQVLRFLLSPEAEHLCRPEEEDEFIATSSSTSSSKNNNYNNKKQLKTYGSLIHSQQQQPPLNPFEELISAVILSRPISHRLGLRTIRTVLNEPYCFSSARIVADADGAGKVRQALWDARTQHKDKTASQLGLAAGVVLEKYATSSAAEAGGGTGPAEGKGGGSKSRGRSSDAGSRGKADDQDDPDGESLAGLISQSGSDIDALLATLTKDIKGFGKTTAAIFRRRIQRAWPFAYPYVDERTADGLRELGLPVRAEELVELIGDHWMSSNGGEEGLENEEGAQVPLAAGGNSRGDKDREGEGEEMQKRWAFTVILERATTARLEGKVGDVLKASVAAAHQA